MFYEVYVKGGDMKDGYSVFFESSLSLSADPKAGLIGDDIITEAIRQEKMDADERPYVEYAKKISEDEYNDATYVPMQHVREVRDKYKDGMSFVGPIADAICDVDSSWSLQLSQLLFEFAQAANKDSSAHIEKMGRDMKSLFPGS